MLIKELLNIKKYYLSLIFFFYIFFYISGPALINIYITLISFIALFYIIRNLNLFIRILKKDSTSLIFFLFTLYVLVVSIFKNNFNIEILSFIRVVLIFLFISIFFQDKVDNLSFKKTLIFFSILISFDSIFQFYFKVNLIGFNIFDSYRLTSFFKDEPIVGSFLLKLTLPLLGIYFYETKENIFLFFIILFSSATIFLSGERMPLLQLSLGYIFLSILYKNKKNVFKFLILFFLIIAILFIFNKNLYERYKTTISTFNFFLNNSIIENNLEKNISVNEYILNFKSGIEVWSFNKIFGGGYRFYKNNCKNLLSDDYYSGCSTHPHNIYLELLADYGLLGLLLFLSFILSLSYKFFKRCHIDHTIGFLILFFVLAFPFATSQSIFSSYYGSIFFLVVFILNYYSKVD